MYLKLHKEMGQVVLAVCDADILGRVIRGEKITIDLSRHQGFYKGKKASGKSEIASLLKEADSANLIGKKCVQIALDEGLASEAQILDIGGVPHVQIYKVFL